MSRISKQKSVIYNGKEVVLYRIANTSGAYIEVLNYGASIVSVVVPDASGKFANVVLKYNTVEDYFTDQFYLGCTVGCYANRISNACFVLNGQTYNVDKNDGTSSNHGGFNGLNKKIFYSQINESSITFFTESIDGEGGFPGNLKFWVTYSFSDENKLRIEYKAVSDKETPVNFTNHTYFNLSGQNADISDHEIQINAGRYLETDNDFLPTGRILFLDNSVFDFRKYKTIGEMITQKKDNLKGYNAFYIKDRDSKIVASARSLSLGIVMDIYTSMSGVLLYTGDFLSGKFKPMSGFCLEAQFHPDGVNRPDFDVNILLPDNIKKDTIEYHFHNGI
ncbi:MAG: aldose epimerase family protein [Dysgonomonas sp.]